MIAKLLMLMGSGETSPTMAKAHREIFSRLGKDPKAVLLDTPFGFQTNADEIAQKAVDYFRTSVGINLARASMKNSDLASSLDIETFTNQVKNADYVFAGPGSPTYALSQWKHTNIASLLRDKLTLGGVVAFSSAAVLTLGRYTIPVYEIYKVGEPVQLREGLNVLDAIGLDALVIPHYNNAEGQNHDTRFCYMGAERLADLKSQMNRESCVIGIDEHTGIVVDLENDIMDIIGLGTVTISKASNEHILRAGDSIRFSEFRNILSELSKFSDTHPSPSTSDFNDQSGTKSNNQQCLVATSPLLANIEHYENDFDVHLSSGNSAGALATMLDLEEELVLWATDTLQSDEIAKGRSALRSMISRLEPALRHGLVSPTVRLAPIVKTLLELRDAARHEKRWGDADLIRDRLDNLGVLVQDTPEGTAWSIKDPTTAY